MYLMITSDPIFGARFVLVVFTEIFMPRATDGRNCEPHNLLPPPQDCVLIRPSYGGIHLLHLFGVFDGHGVDGAGASRYARDRMEALLVEELRGRSGGSLDRMAGLSNEAVVAACKAAFAGVERAMRRTLKVDNSFSGTTAVIVLFIGCRLFAASVGDSRAVLGLRRGDNSNAVEVDALTWDHTPCRADELARIKRAGGIVMSYEEISSSPRGVASPSWHAHLHDKQTSASADLLPCLDPPRVWDKSVSKPGCVCVSCRGRRGGGNRQTDGRTPPLPLPSAHPPTPSHTHPPTTNTQNTKVLLHPELGRLLFQVAGRDRGA